MSDYVPMQLNITIETFTPAIYCILVVIANDEVVERPENFTVALSTTSDFIQLSPEVASISIHDDDGMYIEMISPRVL